MYEGIRGWTRARPDPAMPEHPELWILRAGVQSLCRQRFAALEGEGRSEELHAMLRLAFGDDGGPGHVRPAARARVPAEAGGRPGRPVDAGPCHGVPDAADARPLARRRSCGA